MKKIIRLTESDLHKIVRKVIIEQSEQSKKLYTSWAKNKSGNFDAAMSIMDDVLKNQKSLPKKDFANYSSYDELVKDLDNVMGKKKESDAVKVYEDDTLLVVQANTWEASCKYGAGTKWCTAGKDTSSHWQRHNDKGTEFIWIFKGKPQTDPQYKYSYFVGDNYEDWCDAMNMCRRKLSDDSYPKQHPKYNEILEKLISINKARDIQDPREKERVIHNFIHEWLYQKREQIIPEILNIISIESMWEMGYDEYLTHEVMNMGFGDIDEDILEDIVEELRKDPLSMPRLNNSDMMSNVLDPFTYDILNELNKTISDTGMPRTLESYQTLLTDEFLGKYLEYASEHPLDALDSVNESIMEYFSNVISEELYNTISDMISDRLD